MSDLSGIPRSANPVRIAILQGDARASADPAVEFSTILGSCVATCLYDPVARIGGMNHFLLAEPPSHKSQTDFDEHYGLFLMELLVNEMLALGAAKPRLKARLYGGANLHERLAPIGSANAAFARRFIRDERIALVHEDLEGHQARRVNFQPTSGRVRCLVAKYDAVPTDKPLRRPQSACGEVELF
ncbi:chemotaxis protein CheD [Alteraurantiacibacter aquimixticola]|uniref:Probable chemoreceptor glutamine deamidase CheD n=1 Tax=Alteraurantiacibacter aquimixticola TaxID=2489173 RepID=A0A4T3EYC6_9SPHN|nr:chemotaxis protein CheD [Alteraurantiacibacter aquimixticola]TIX49071.1 chemotaxis protein CheD [Alteraurantiacibacter aquimixticola]